jgi:hypothetical protein
MKSVLNATMGQAIVGENSWSSTLGYIFTNRTADSDNFSFKYANGTSAISASFTNFFQNLDNQ